MKKPTIGQTVWIVEPSSRFRNPPNFRTVREETVEDVWKDGFAVATGEVFNLPSWSDLDDARVEVFPTKLAALDRKEACNLTLDIRSTLQGPLPLTTLRAVHKLILEATEPK